VMLNCPGPAELIALALDEAANEPIARHAFGCARCRREVISLREGVNALRVGRIAATIPAIRCLADDQLAALADGPDEEADAGTLEHLGRCPLCSARLAGVTRLLRDEEIARQLRRLEVDDPILPRRARVRAATVIATFAAAAVAAVLLPLPIGRTPAPPSEVAPAHRESAITTTVAPRIVPPGATAGASDSLRWTSVPRADRYELKMFDREGTLVWNPVTSDTVIPLPANLSRGDAPITYLWKVEARTGWDRWVASEWADLTVGSVGEP
jgi:hypothetical protein